jgi:phosphatidylglycerophosphate synthase
MNSGAESLEAEPGRPVEIESPTNRFVVHPVSRALVDLLIHTPVTPNQMSVASAVAAGVGAACYVVLPWPWNAVVGLAFQFAWHVLDGADGDLARRTGRASPTGELIDGVCDHLSQVMLYLALAILARRAVGDWAWAIAGAAGLSHFVQANAYETGRKTYRRWVYGAPWMRQSHSQTMGRLERGLGAFYLAVSDLANPGEDRVEAAMGPPLAAGNPRAGTARALYRRLFAPLVSMSGMLGANSRTITAFLCVLVGRPVWYFIYEITALNVLLLAITIARRAQNARLAAQLST